MRAYFITFTLFFLVFFQVAEACCEHGEHASEKPIPALQVETNTTPDSVAHHHGDHHHGPCGCACHQIPQQEKGTAPSSRIELEPVTAMALSAQRNRCGYTEKPQATPLLARYTSLPPPTAAELCTHHCRFLL